MFLHLFVFEHLIKIIGFKKYVLKETCYNVFDLLEK